ncbi:phosphonate ABC transporter, permease protein PhnE [Budviciaceae bacterium CWB-B4]|uniref:Phosphonate ABC transporter, permease protein PhnE n=1 Tax=Limnobaculum xujianqingii TaxID=2738837 RepID=A0A9D7AIT0_9GAMM|nr:phosphonate ABC transporter, permease protein PhnE [Limnobaculum xujianqingii]MBK5073333.1 phosphonate ABC transporter, permease protein PhnE [Limnobaculum xujianqingii]MBK5176936.1 phosphonate ABC transporter, permease protein PhnE [Limnobaculum xujianqingii]
MAGVTPHLNPFKANWLMRVGTLVVAGYILYAFSNMGLNFQRMAIGMEHAERLLSRMFPPNFERWELLLHDLMESLQIAIIASAVGIIISLFVGLFAARNLMPNIISAPARVIIAICRTFHPVIIAILFVKSVGFGALAGILTLIVASIGFIAKLFAEAIEEISLKQVEAIRATGASFVSLILFAVLPQVFSRFIGFSTYQLDSNLRNSTMVGLVGAGGLGGTLFSAFQRFDYDFVTAILLTIIALILLGEALSNLVRRVFSS